MYVYLLIFYLSIVNYIYLLKSKRQNIDSWVNMSYTQLSLNNLNLNGDKREFDLCMSKTTKINFKGPKTFTKFYSY